MVTMSHTSRTGTPTEVLAALVERVTFHNSENGSASSVSKPAGYAT